MLECAQHMTRPVDDLLDVSRLTRNKLALKRADLDLGATTAGVAEEVQSEYRECDVRLQVQPDVRNFRAISGPTRRPAAVMRGHDGCW